ncbi:MAG TPA: hypothetical protein VG407_11800 [Caulobacteraceae bacterium]|jgi:uncharacterized membrane protein|nr:hypothetical protein [Caulobacteraceae bacterium]
MSVERVALPPENGKTAALVIYVLYLLSLPSIGLLMFAGVIFAYIRRGSAVDWVRTHYDHLIKVFWTTFWWTVLGGVLWFVAVPLYLVFGLGALIHGAIAIGAVILAVWFHLVSLIGILRLVQDKPY